METSKSLKRIQNILSRSRITNREFVQWVNTINASPNQKHFLDKTPESFDKIGERKNHYSINTLLSICSTFKPEIIVSVWDDISNSNNLNRVSLPLVIKCCSNTFKCCSNTVDTEKCIEILNHIKSSIIFNSNSKFNKIDIHSSLISGYITVSQFNDALNAFLDIPDEHKLSEHLGALMTGYLTHKRYDDALSIYHQHQSLHNDVIHLIALRVCKETDNRQFGEQIISNVIGLDPNDHDIEFLNSVIDFHGHFGNLHEAQTLFIAMHPSKRDTITLNSMMKSCTRNHGSTQSLALYEGHSHLHDDISHLLALRSCIQLDLYQNGCDIIDQQIIHRNIECGEVIMELLNVVIDFYASFGMTKEAQSIFNRIPYSDRNSIALGSLMKCYLHQLQYEEVMDLHTEYKHLRNDTIHLLAIRACAHCRDFEGGNGIIRDYIDLIDGDQHDIELLNAMIDFYAESGDLKAAKRVFLSIPISERKSNVITIGSMMKCLIQNGESKKALELHRKSSKGIIHNEITHLLALKACIDCKEYQYGYRVIKEYIGNRYHHGYHWVNCMELATTIIDFYGESGNVEKAEELFHSIPDHEKNVIMVNAMMNVYCINDTENKCIQLMKDLLNIGDMNKGRKGRKRRFPKVTPDHVTFATALKACVQCTSLHFGQKIHDHLQSHSESQWILNSLTVQICLICVYGKGGKVDSCLEIWNEIKENEPLKHRTEIALWNAMMNVFGRNGEHHRALELFEIMKRETELIPNDRTYCIVINACSHSGDVERAMDIWKEDIAGDEGALYRNVNTAMIDCLSRRGRLEEAMEHLMEYENMQIAGREKYERDEERHLPWMALLNGCCKCGHRVVAERVFSEMKLRFEDHPIMAQASVLFANTFTRAQQKFKK